MSPTKLKGLAHRAIDRPSWFAPQCPGILVPSDFKGAGRVSVSKEYFDRFCAIKPPSVPDIYASVMAGFQPFGPDRSKQWSDLDKQVSRRLNAERKKRDHERDMIQMAFGVGLGQTHSPLLASQNYPMAAELFHKAFKKGMKLNKLHDGKISLEVFEYAEKRYIELVNEIGSETTSD